MIEVRGLTKRYGEVTAVSDLSFNVMPGKVTGFLGPNGAGKTTTMRLILGLDYPNAGTVTIDGKHYASLAYPMREVGALLDARAVYGGRSAYNHLLCLAQTNNLPKRRVGEVLELVGLTEVARKRAKGFSLGMSQRLVEHEHGRVAEQGGGRGPDRVRVQPPDVGDAEHRRPPDRDRPRPAARRLHHGGVHRPQFGADRENLHASA